MEQSYCSTRARKWEQLSEKDRYQIEALYGQGLSARQIGQALSPKRDRRTIERELALGMVEQKRMNPSFKKGEPLYVVELVYRADTAQMRREEKAAKKGRGLKIGHDQALADYIEAKIKEDKWSPDAIVGRLKIENQFGTKICTKTVYNYISWGLFREISNKDLWVKRDGRKRNYRKIRTVALNNKNGKSISERPESVNTREEAGHWEIDLVVGKQGTKPAVLTLVERKSRRSVYVPIRNKTQEEVLGALRRARKRVGGDFSEVFKTLTADNGSEFLDSNGLKEAAGCEEVYYAHPYSSWERGSNENGNRMLRRFIPKGMDLSALTEQQLQRYEDWVNNYPRRLLGYKTANEAAG